MKFSVKKEFFFCYGHRLREYVGPCQHIHGHNGKIEVELEADQLDGRDMVVDFSDISRSIKKWVDETLDHNVLLRKDDPLVPVLEKMKERFFVMDSNPTAEAIARLVYQQAAALGFPVKCVTLWETNSSSATFNGP